ncbi:glucan biosynthesis protein G [Pelagicoccus sp. SDUM812003]|nr:glucan biosynthesis protein G [Pelagicoccus sp. SDUM812003]
MRRVEVDFEYVSEIAAERSERAYQAPTPVPEALMDLDYDEYRKISYNNDSYLWKNEGLPFALGFFHPGFLHGNRVAVNEFTATHAQRIPYLSTFFEFQDKELEKALPKSLDFAGFRISSSVGNENDYREVASFLGASYFRGTGYDINYGTSSRGIAINSGLGEPEEFPRFVEVWLGKPKPNARELTLYALLDGPSVTGAYQFVIHPGEDTVMNVKARLFLRESVESFGVAPLTSMFWRGENRKSPESDYRPEVHDADGLIVKETDAAPIWRALDLADKTRLSYFSVSRLSGFGLFQRDREFENYQDLEAHYHRRPSVWIDTRGDWGKGYIKLVELPTSNEFEDNVVAFWEPAVLPEKGSALDYEYDIHWFGEPAPETYPQCTVRSTRVGEDQSYPGSHVFVIDFEGAGEDAGQPELVTAVDGAATLMDKQVVWNPYLETWRVILRLEQTAEEGVIELRSQLLFPIGAESEVWAYQWTL